MLYHGAYLSNYMNWLKDPGDYFPSAHLVWTDIGIAQIFLIQIPLAHTKVLLSHLEFSIFGVLQE